MTATEPERQARDVDGSFEAFYRAEQPGQVRRAALILGSSEAGNDAVHDAFVEIFRHWGTIDFPGPYLNRAVLNRCRDLSRTQRRRSGILARYAADDQWTTDNEPIADLLDRLTFNQRAVVVLRFYIGMNNREIAEALGCPPGSVGPWLARALAQLRKELS